MSIDELMQTIEQQGIEIAAQKARADKAEERVRELQELSVESVRLLGEFSEEYDEDSSNSHISATISGDWFYDVKKRLEALTGQEVQNG